MNVQKQTPASPYRLEKAREEEIGRVAELYHSAIGRPFCPWNELYPTVEEARDDWEHSGLYVLKNGNAVAGAVSVYWKNEWDGLDCWQFRAGTVREIGRIVIAPEETGKGLSRTMLCALFDRLKNDGANCVRLLVGIGNEPAIGLYRSLGFHFRGRTEMYDAQYFACEKEL